MCFLYSVERISQPSVPLVTAVDLEDESPLSIASLVKKSGSAAATALSSSVAIRFHVPNIAF